MLKYLIVAEYSAKYQYLKNNLGRTDVNWAYALNSDIVSFTDVKKHGIDRYYDVVICIIPKQINNDVFDVFDYLDSNENVKLLGILQEGPHTYYQDYNLKLQIEYLNRLIKCDFILCHNEYDLKYYEGLVFNTNTLVSVIPTISYMPNTVKVNYKENRSGVMIGGTFCSWYNGMDSFVVAAAIEDNKTDSIYAPKMGRFKYESDSNADNVKWLNYTDWERWMAHLNERKYAVHLMRTTAAGSFALNCAQLGIPCIGWNLMDTQRYLFPELSLDTGDLKSAIKVGIALRTNELFYNHCVEYAKKIYKEQFSETAFLVKMEEFFNNIIKNK